MTLFARREVVVDGIPTIYRLHVPEQLDTPAPVILFLHGAGESGTDGLAPTTVGIGPAITRQPQRFPALVVFPQASRGYGWRGFNLAAAVAALDDVERSHDVDRSRIAVTGISMGGYGTWLLALQQPERFAAIAPVCGGLDAGSAIRAGLLRATAADAIYDEAAEKLAHLPQWIFHGDADDVIPVGESRRMVSALEAAGATKVRYTEYPGVRHNSWDRAYAEADLVPWLLGMNFATAADR